MTLPLSELLLPTLYSLLHSTCVHLGLSVLVAMALSAPYIAHAQQHGDFLFQDLDCGPLCDAIEAVTPAFDGRHFSHVGLVERRGDSLYVVEAISRGGVVRTPLAGFLSRAVDSSGRPAFTSMRLAPQHADLLGRALAFCDSAMGTPYDEVYLLDNGAYYCSELLYEAFRAANDGEAFFALHPMTFRRPGGRAFDPAWVAYYEALGTSIPEGQPGSNPGGLAVGGRLVRTE